MKDVDQYNSAREESEYRQALREMLMEIWSGKARFVSTFLPGLHIINVSNMDDVFEEKIEESVANLEPENEEAKKSKETQTLPLELWCSD